LGVKATNVLPSKENSSPAIAGQFVARAPAVREHARKLERAAALDANVLIHGPIGSGKTTAAGLIHELGARSDCRFVSLNAADTPTAELESWLSGDRSHSMAGGTLVLENVEELSPELQRQLLRFLQSRVLLSADGAPRLEVRVIATSRADLKRMAQDGRFREDLYYRLSVLSINAPSVAERREDLNELIDRFLHRCGGNLRLTAEARAALLEYSWPGNLRELQNVLERAHAFSRTDVVGLELIEFPEHASTPEPGRPNLAGYTMDEIERWALQDTLEAVGGNKAAASRALGLCEKTIYNKLKRMR
jgi:DNA-binding NtrC family response regulator